MTRVNLGLYASAAASLVVTEQGPHSVVSSVAFAAPELTQINRATQGPDMSSSAACAESLRQAPIDGPMVTRWTKQEKARYKQLVVKLATSDLSQAESQELHGLEVARNRFEDSRSSEELLAEFRTRQLYANLLNSLKSASVR